MLDMMQLRVWLLDSQPEVWRRLIVDPRLTLEQLHTVLQAAFGWTNSHMHQFHEEDGRRYAMPVPRGMGWGIDVGGESIDERKVTLARVFDRKKKRIAYVYDFGDSWMHAVEFEMMVDSEAINYAGETFVEKGRGVFSGKKRAAVCLSGERNGPPEDCGGLYGFQEILELKINPPHPTAKKDADARERMEWLGDWDPALCDLNGINQYIGRVRVKKAFSAGLNTERPDG